MRRKRYMKGSVRPRKHGRHKVWVAQWWEEGGRRSRVLGKCSEMSKDQAETIMASILDPLNEKAGTREPRSFTFKQYVEDVYLPVCRRKWKESTRMTGRAVAATRSASRTSMPGTATGVTLAPATSSPASTA